MTTADYEVQRSRATEPLFFRAPHPAQVNPYEYQMAGVEYALARDHALIADEPGLGKTMQGILISNAIKAKRTLVVCPASLRLNWEREIWKTSTIPNVGTYCVVSSRSGVSVAADYLIVSYDLLRNPAIFNAIVAQKWDHTILDECHKIKDPAGTKTSRLITSAELRSATGRFTLLSGTPMPNQPVEVYVPARMLDWGCIDNMSLQDFREYYYAEGEGMVRGKVWDPDIKAFVSKVHFSNTIRNVPRREDELQHRLRSRIMVRRQKADVLKELPPKQFHLVPLAQTAEMRAALAHPGWATATKLYDLDPDEFDGSLPIDGEISTARRLLGEAKAAPACGYIDDLLESGVEKVVVSAWHASVLKVARAKLEKHGLVYMDGTTGNTARQKAVDAFNKDPKVRVILGQTAVMGEGHTLATAQDVVLLEPDWTPGRVEQMIDRIHRIGQRGSYVMAHLPVVPGSLDERVLSVAIQKDKSIYRALDAQ